MIKLTFSNTNDLPGILYAQGYEQVIYLDSEVNTPSVTAEEQPVEDGFGSVKYIFARVSLITRFEAANVSDDSIFAIRLARYHDTIKLKDLSTGQEFEVINLSASEITQPNRLSKVVFEATLKEVTVSGCGIDYQSYEC